MKKYITLIVLALGVTFPIQAQYLFRKEDHETLNAQIQRNMAIQKQIQSTLTIEVPVTKQYFTDEDEVHFNFANSARYRTRHHAPRYKSTVGCKAYALDDHWLIAGAVCLWNGRHTVHIKGKTYPTGLIEEDFSQTYLKVNGIEIPMDGNLFIQPRFTIAPHFMLVRVPQDSELAATVQKMPKINILGLAHTNPLNLEKGSFHVNTSRFGGDSARWRRLDTYDDTTHTITIKEHLEELSTLSNDPLLYVFQDQVYWIGINDGIMLTFPNGKWDGKPSKSFVTFNDWDDFAFIQRTITEQDPAAWPRVTQRLFVDHVR